MNTFCAFIPRRWLGKSEISQTRDGYRQIAISRGGSRIQGRRPLLETLIKDPQAPIFPSFPLPPLTTLAKAVWSCGDEIVGSLPQVKSGSLDTGRARKRDAYNVHRYTMYTPYSTLAILETSLRTKSTFHESSLVTLLTARLERRAFESRSIVTALFKSHLLIRKSRTDTVVRNLSLVCQGQNFFILYILSKLCE